jgi:guanylate kinase
VKRFPVVLSAPSGAGKTTLAHRLRACRDDIEFSVSATTRAPRPGERDGIDYHFVDEPGFRRMIAAGELIEWAEVHGSLYGTPIGNARAAAEAGRFLLLDIDVQGARQIRITLPEAVLVYIAPPDGATLVERLTGRGSEDDARLRRRLGNALDELAAAREFDHVIVNDDLDAAVADLTAVLEGRSRDLRPHPPLDDWIQAVSGEIRSHLAGV